MNREARVPMSELLGTNPRPRYTDDIAEMQAQIARQQRMLDELAHALEAHQRAVERMAEYQGVKHLLSPQ